MILAGDIGGTKTNVALFQRDGSNIGPVVRQQTFRSGGHDSLESILREFLEQDSSQVQVEAACFGIAAPIIEGQAKPPNLTWGVNSVALARMLNIPRVGLINDLEATAHGVAGLNASQLLTLNNGEQRVGANRALVAAGTGLGTAGIIYRDGHYHPMPSEGGHADFAPGTPEEIDLLLYLRDKFGEHVSYERVLSGPGLFNVYSFVRDYQKGVEPQWLAEQIATGDKTAAVSQAALENRCELAVKALDIFVSAYGAMAGNLALVMLANGGLYVGGGIAPKIREKLKDGTFMRAFTRKGRLSSLVSTIPVHVILEDKTALFGAARAALDFHW